MIKTKVLTATALAVSLAAATAFAQTDPHHPQGNVAAQPAAPTAAPSASSGSGMMMPGGAGMMGLMNMMGQGGMNMPDMGMHGMDMRGMAMSERVEGRIAFLRTELKISDAQAKVWNDFAQSLRENAKRLGAVRDAAAKGAGSIPGLPQRLESQERWLAARLEGVRSIKLTLSHLYEVLSSDQKKAADELLGMHLGLMPSGMMSMSGGMMPMGENVR